MKVVIACDSFKGTFSSSEIGRRLTEAIHEKDPTIEVTALTVSDGGEGVVEALRDALGGQIVRATVTDPNFEQVDAEYLLCGELAVIESAQAAGITLCKPLDTKKKTTYGVGELIRSAYEKGAKRILLGLGGSGTTDGGCGMAAALGTKFYDKEGKQMIPVGETLAKIETVEINKKYDVVALCDVKNPLVGEMGSAKIYGPQKGASESDVRMLDEGLKHLSEVIGSHGYEYMDIPGAGAAGGLGYGVLAFTNGQLKRGVDAILDEIGFSRAVENADLIVTGEGALDHQSFLGKVVEGVLSKNDGVPTAAFVGIAKIDDWQERGLCAVFETNEEHLPFDEIRDRLDEQFNRAAEKLATYIVDLK